LAAVERNVAAGSIALESDDAEVTGAGHEIDATRDPKFFVELVNQQNFLGATRLRGGLAGAATQA
jgi:hypothetical protein